MKIIARNASQIGAAIRRYRSAKDLTQGGLGDLMHARQATVSKLESGEPGTQLGVLIDALSALDLEVVIQPRTKASSDDIEDIF